MGIGIEELRAWRKRLGLSVERAAEMVHYSRNHLYNVEAGRMRLTPGLAHVLTEAYRRYEDEQRTDRGIV